MTQMIRPGFTGSTLDRVDHVRDDADALAALRSDPSARLLRQSIGGLQQSLRTRSELTISPC